MKGKIIKVAVCSFFMGVFLYAFIDIPIGALFVVLSFFFFLILISYKKNVHLLFICIAVIFVCFGFLRHYSVIPNIDDSSVHFYQNTDNVRKIRGVVSDEPDRRLQKANYVLEVKKILIDGKWKEIHGRILFSKDLYPDYQYGDYLEVVGFILEPPEFESFSYKRYLSLSGIYSVMYYPRTSIIGNNQGNKFYSVLFKIKDNFKNRLNKLFPEPMASFAAGLLAGARKGMPDDVVGNFNLTGLSHIIAISGYHISLVIFLISSIFDKAPRKVKFFAIIFFVIIFALFVGASAAVVRASVMGVFSVLALWWGRQMQIINVLLISAFLMVFYNPYILLFDVGFQLSFLATFGLIMTGERIKHFFTFLPDFFGLREIFAMTFSAQIFALPVILASFKRLSLISPIANILVVPVIPIAMLFGFASVVVSYLNFTVGFVLMLPAWLVLKYCLKVIEILAHLPWSAYEVQWFSHYLIIVYFFILILLTYFIYPYFRNTLLRV